MLSTTVFAGIITTAKETKAETIGRQAMAGSSITKAQVRELPRKYAIGKRPLSKVLGWGELTYSRILDGSTPTEEHAQEILRALEDPVFFSMLLENANRKGVLTPLCYERSRKAVDEFLKEDEQATDIMKMQEAGKAICILTEGEVTCIGIQILMYFAYGSSLKELKEPLFNQLPVATDDGPAYPEMDGWFTSDRIREFADMSLDNVELSKEEVLILQNIVDEYGIYSSRGLKKLACAQVPWKKARKKGSKTEDGAMVMSLKSMRKFFLG